MNDSYRNPFSGVNAVQLDISSILEYWCNPFTYDLFSEIKEDDIFQDPNNIVFMGGRSTGKSMFLRYWSYPVQFKIAEKDKVLLTDLIKKNKGIGFYFRIDGPVLRSFQGNGLSEEHWSSVFTHYFELLLGRQYIEVLKIFQDEGLIEKEIIENAFIPKLCAHLDFTFKYTIDEVIEEFNKRIMHVDLYRGNVAFYKKPFNPGERAFSSESISFGISEIILNTIPAFKNINILILLDEYENFLEYQQVVINTLLRFTRPQIKFRIGMRLEGFRTFKMITEDDFIKEGREYRKVVFEEVLNKDKGYHDFLVEIARKRLESVPILKEKHFTDIKSILSESENLEDEASNLTENMPDKIYDFFAKSKKISQQNLDMVRYKDNPLLELMNFILLMRGISPEEIVQSMTDYLQNKKTKRAKKYRMDYVDKYKLSLMFLLCSIYRKNKKYYSFNTFAFLSSGIVGHFIELCRRSFAIAGWGDNEKLFQEGKIDKEFQSSAAIDFSTAEKQQISRIEDYGGKISRFVENIGNIFRAYHLDFGMRYPETNQFAINIDAIENKELRNAMKSAIKWSIVQKKPRMQRSSPNENLQDIYTLNRIFSPSFQISYRTRGGKSIRLHEKQLSDLMSTLGNISEYVPKETIVNESDKIATPSLFQDL